MWPRLHNLRTSLLSRIVAAILVLGLMTASVPIAVSAAVSGSKTPCLSADICHPLQSLDRTADVVPMARPAALARESALTEFSGAPEFHPAVLLDLIFAPDPPPPKTLS
ncbi:MAG: hypothetical protein ACREQR_10215 [Candidatus Binataceae bacterium]